jgi:rhodanese-related sulfurtransferase
MTAIKSIDIQTMQQWQASGEAILVDVREPAEHAEASIPGAVLIPMAEVNKAALSTLGGNKWVLHCRSGGRSRRVCEQLLTEDASLEVYNLEGGIRAWQELSNK